jgi:hypothetical protein
MADHHLLSLFDHTEKAIFLPLGKQYAKQNISKTHTSHRDNTTDNP